MTGWQDRAACRDVNPDLFFPATSDPGNEAKRICAGCPVRLQCLRDAKTRREEHGVWGGLLFGRSRQADVKVQVKPPRQAADLNQDPARLKAARLSCRLSLRAAARAAAMTPGYLSDLEGGYRSASPEILARLAAAYSCGIPDLASAAPCGSGASQAVLTAANAHRAGSAGRRDAGRLRQALDLTGPGCPTHYRRVAEARIAAPDMPWSQVAASLGLTKSQATSYARRLLRLVPVNGCGIPDLSPAGRHQNQSYDTEAGAA